jgi:hypothetical protein
LSRHTGASIQTIVEHGLLRVRLARMDADRLVNLFHFATLKKGDAAASMRAFVEVYSQRDRVFSGI